MIRWNMMHVRAVWNLHAKSDIKRIEKVQNVIHKIGS